MDLDKYKLKNTNQKFEKTEFKQFLNLKIFDYFAVLKFGVLVKFSIDLDLELE